MNKPNEELLADWLDGKLEGDELSHMEAWAAEHAGDQDSEFKCEIGWNALSDELFTSMPKSEEPPYPEFFNSKLEQAIMSEAQSDEMENVSLVASKNSEGLLQKLRIMLIPATVAAAVAFYAGMQMKDDRNPNEGMVEVIYLPDEDVQAVVSDRTEATEIVLDGLNPISDDFDMTVSSVLSEPDLKTGASLVIISQDEDKEFY